MSRPSTATVTAAIIGGLANVAVVLALYSRAEYPTLESSTELALLVLTGFTLGFVLLFVSVHTRLLTPASGFLAVLAITSYLELTSPNPEWSELNGYTIVDGPTHISSYANTWYVWLALLLFAGVVEFGVRRGYAVGDHRLRNLPSLPFPGRTLGWTVAGFSGSVGTATMLLVIRSGIRPPSAALIVLVATTAAAAIPLVALLARGMVLPITLFALLIPYYLGVEVFTSTDSPVHIILFGLYAIVFAIVWALEAAIRSRLRGWNGGRFTARKTEGWQ